MRAWRAAELVVQECSKGLGDGRLISVPNYRPSHLPRIASTVSTVQTDVIQIPEMTAKYGLPGPR